MKVVIRSRLPEKLETELRTVRNRRATLDAAAKAWAETKQLTEDQLQSFADGLEELISQALRRRSNADAAKSAGLRRARERFKPTSQKTGRIAHHDEFSESERPWVGIAALQAFDALGACRLAAALGKKLSVTCDQYNGCYSGPGLELSRHTSASATTGYPNGYAYKASHSAHSFALKPAGFQKLGQSFLRANVFPRSLGPCLPRLV